METKEAKNQDETVLQKENVVGPKALPYAFEKEIKQKQAKHFWIVEEFIPIAVARRIYTLERKLNSRYEQELPLRWEEQIRNTELSSRRTQYGLPLLESQVYGWLPKGMRHDDKALSELNSIRAPKLRCDMTIYGEKLMSERITERPRFNGLRFFV